MSFSGTRSRALVLSAALLASVQAQTPLNAELIGVYATINVSSLALIAIDVDTGANRTIANVSFGPLTSTFPAKSAYNPDSGQLCVVVVGGASVFGVDVRTAAVSSLAPLPAYNEVRRNTVDDTRWVMGCSSLSFRTFAPSLRSRTALSA